MVADLARGGGAVDAVRGRGGARGSVAQPQSGDPAGADRRRARLARHRERGVRQPRSVRRPRGERQVRHHPEPDGGHDLQPRLLADRVGPAADRDEPALRALLPRAASVLPRRAGDLPDRDAADPAAHAHDRRPAFRRQADREGRQDHARRHRRGRRGGRPPGRRRGPALRHNRADVRRAGPLRPLLRIVRGRHHDGPGVRSGLQPRGRRRRAVPTRTHAPLQLHGRRVGDAQRGIRFSPGARVRSGFHAPGAQS